MKTQYLIIPTILTLLLLIACAGQVAEKPEGTSTDAGESAAGADSEEIVVTIAPEPTATPGPVSREITDIVESSKLSGTIILGLTADDWINLAISVLIIIAGYVIGTILTKGLIHWVVRRTSLEIGNVIQESIGPRLRWLVIIPFFNIGTIRLDFVSPDLKSLLSNIYFVLAVILATLIVWNLVNSGYKFYQQKYAAEERGDELEPVLILIKLVIQIFVILLSISILFARFGINLSALLATFGVAGLAISLAAQDTLADAIAGFIILIDQPYRIGDRIEIQDDGTWGDVVQIGIRTTRIRTRDNRLVIVPNSVISKNQVINYTYPDPRYRIQTHISIGYGSDIEVVRQLIIDTVSQVEGVLPDQPVESLYLEMGDSGMIFRVRWWLASYEDTRRMFDRVNTALQNTFDANGIALPNPIQTTKLEVDDRTALNLSRVFRS